MDDELERLERDHRASPTPETAARLKAALLRAGRREELRGRYRLGFACAQPWENMVALDPLGSVRNCEACRREVHLASTYAQFDQLAAAGHCVAVLPQQLPDVLDGLIDAPGRPLSRGPGDPCLLQGTPPAPFVRHVPVPGMAAPMPPPSRVPPRPAPDPPRRK